MGYTKAQRRAQEEIHDKIMDGYRRGVCDAYGRTVKAGDGRPIARPRFARSSAVKVYRWDGKGKLVLVQ